ncbi:MAG TPA: hypothetical protein VJ770_14870 [Stellaceae bacterium]|nr:hypothetical protein [Stellaceae bacterium]
MPIRPCRRALALLFLTLPAAAAAAAPTSVAVSLGDTPQGKDVLALNPDRVKAGAIEFHVKNTSKSLTHEFLIVRWPGAITSLPYDAKNNEVQEERLPGLEGVEDMPPGSAATVRLVLGPGKYVVFCNQLGHYKAGMERRFTVTR